MNNETKFLVNGKPMTNREYLELVSKSREAQKAYMQTPEYKAEQDEKARMTKLREEHTNKFLEFGKKLGLSVSEIGSIGLKLYQDSKKVE